MNDVEIDFYKGHSAQWVFDTPLVDTIMCSHCLYQLPSSEFAMPFCANCGYAMTNLEEMVGNYND